MGLKVGAKLPDARLLTMGEDGQPAPVQLGDRLKGRKVVIFALPGAFTGTCSTSHFPSFVRTADRLREKGVDEIICLSVNDPFTLKAWGEQLGGDKAGITMLADAEGSLTRALGQEFSVPDRGLIGRSKRYAIVVENGVIVKVHEGDKPGSCDISAGEAVLETL